MADWRFRRTTVATMRYEISHTTEYDYSESVAVAHHVARLRPRSMAKQECVAHELVVTPTPAVVSTHQDYFGNTVTVFGVQGQHKNLTIHARSTVEVESPMWPDPERTAAWELAVDRTTMPFEAIEFVFDTEDFKPPSSLERYTRPSFTRGRPLLTAVLDLTARIHRDFTFDPRATTVATPLSDVFAAKRGVCQDFARLEIACLRTIGIPARYVSGYLETDPPPNTPRLLGADASHAWLTVHCPDVGWIPADPTNNVLPEERHITLAWGRDYSDISPIRGVILGGGAHSLRVQVDVVRRTDALPTPPNPP